MLSAFKPQTKRFEINILNTQYFLRLAYVKNNQLETFVIRILNPPQLLSIDSLFDPSNYLVSPFNSTKEFVKNNYFLTDHQEEIKNNIIFGL